MWIRILIITLLAAVGLASTASSAGPRFPATIALPDGWQPEGIAVGRGNDFFVGSIPTGAVYAGDLRTGSGDVLVPPQAGRAAIGIKVDRRNRLFVAGGPTGMAWVYSAKDGSDLGEFSLTGEPTFVNDVVVTRKAAYFTDSLQQQLYVLDLGKRRALPQQARTLPLTGELQYDDDPSTFELNGIVATPNGKRLISVQSHTGKLFVIDPRTGDTDEIALDGAPVVNGDGLLLHGRTLYVVQNRLNQIAVIRLDRGLEAGRAVRTITNADFDVPTTIARKGRFLWAVNARFGSPPDPATADKDIVRVRR